MRLGMGGGSDRTNWPSNLRHGSVVRRIGMMRLLRSGDDWKLGQGEVGCIYYRV